MAKYVNKFKGDFHDFVNYIEKQVIDGSITASLEDKHSVEFDECQCTVMVFERYSYSGKNRVSMNVTILGYKSDIEIIAITSGGSQAAFFKINTLGEENFLDTIIQPVEKYINQNKKVR